MASFYDLPLDVSVRTSRSLLKFTRVCCEVVIVISTAKMKMEPTWEWVIERVGHPTTTYNLNRLLEAKQSNRPGNAQLMVGRRESVDIYCNGSTVSRLHCEFNYCKNSFHWSVTERSMNGVYINSQRIPTATPTQLEDKDLIGIGAVNPAQAEDHFVFQVLRINKKLVADRQNASSRGNLHLVERVLVEEEPSLAEYAVIPTSHVPALPSIAFDSTRTPRHSGQIHSISGSRLVSHQDKDSAVASTSAAPTPSAVVSPSTGLSSHQSVVSKPKSDLHRHSAVASGSKDHADPLAGSRLKNNSHSEDTSKSNACVDSTTVSASKTNAQSRTTPNSGKNRDSLSTTVECDNLTFLGEETEKEIVTASSSKYFKTPLACKLNAKDKKLLSPSFVRLERDEAIDTQATQTKSSSKLPANQNDELDEIIVRKPMTMIPSRFYRRIVSESEDDNDVTTFVAPLSPRLIKQEVISPEQPTLSKCGVKDTPESINSRECEVGESKKQTNSKFVIQKLFDNPDQYLVNGSNHGVADFYSPTLECIDLVDDSEDEAKNIPQSNSEPDYEDSDVLENYSDDDIFLKIFEDDGRLSDVSINKEPPNNFKTSVEESDDDDELQLWSISLSQTPTKRQITDHNDSPLLITLDDDEPECPVLSAEKNNGRPYTEVSSEVAQAENDQFWPELSQNFFDDDKEERKEGNENCSAGKDPSRAGSKSEHSDRLERLSKEDRVKPPTRTILTCPPKPLEPNKRKRFSLTNDHSSSSRDSRTENTTTASKTPRVLKIISPRHQSSSSRRRSSKKNETVEKMKQTIEGGKTWIRPSSSSSKKSEISTNPVPAVGTGLSKKSLPLPKIPRKSNAAPIVKAKTTAISRSDLLVQDLIGSKNPETSNKATDKTSEYYIPKSKDATAEAGPSKRKAHEDEGGPSKKRTCEDGTRASKKKAIEDEAESSDQNIPLTSSEHVPKKKRIARVSEVSELNRASEGSKSSISSTNSKGKSWATKSKYRMDAFSETLIALGNRPVTKKPTNKKVTTSSSSSPSLKEAHTSKDPVSEAIQKVIPTGSTSTLSHTPIPEEATVLPVNGSDVNTSLDGNALNKSCLKRFGLSSPGTKKTVKIMLEKNSTRFIEPRSDSPKEALVPVQPPLLPSPLCSNIPICLPQPPVLSLPPPPISVPLQRTRFPNEYRLPNVGNQLISDMKMRILKWNYQWIHEQKKFTQSTAPTPPLLLAASESLPDLRDKPVNSTYGNLEQYFDVFHPLMLHELWAQITKECEEQTKLRWDLSINSMITDEGFFLIRCTTTVDDYYKAPRESDLVVLKFTWKAKKNAIFGIVENARVIATKDRHKNVCEFMLRVRSNIRSVISGKNKFTIERVYSLWLLFKQLKVHGRLSFSPLCHVILSISRPQEKTFEFIQKEPEFEIDPLLNPSQRAAVASVAVTIVEAPTHEPKIALLQGPPGTGKSHVIVQIVKGIIHQHLIKTKVLPRILICAPSNFAVDEIAYRLLQEKRKSPKQQIKLVRVGVPESMHYRVKDISVDDLAERLHRYQCSNLESPESNNIAGGKQELNILMNKKKGILAQLEVANAENNRDQSRRLGRALEKLEESIDAHQESLNKSYDLHYQFFKKNPAETRRAVISEADIICSTLNSCNNKDMDSVFVSQRSNRPFLCCIVDEASQCTEPESLTPLILGINKLVMVGDPEQLPATVCSKVSKERHFDQSLFNRFFSYLPFNSDSNRMSVLMLNTQYRMHPDICYWPSKFFYGNQLITSESVVRKSPFNAYRVFNVLDSEERFDEQNISNENEAELVARLVQALIEGSLAGSRSIGIITFYQKQRSLIQEKLKSKCHERVTRRVKVNTVDAFQGQEEDIIIVSCVRASKKHNKRLGFVTIPQRLNVALTRAKESLFVCGHFDTLRTDETWKDMIEDATQRSLTHNVTSVFEISSLRPLLIKK